MSAVDLTPVAVPGFGLLRAPHELRFGDGVAALLGRSARRHGKRAFVCIDAVLTETEVGAGALASLAEHGVETELETEVMPELPLESTLRVAARAAAFAPDVVIGIGGGSSIDLAKLTAVLCRGGGDPRELYGENAVAAPGLPLIAVPSTAGTGSEVSPVAVLSDPDRELKVGVSSPYLIPASALCDPLLTVSCPPAVTAHAGIDALGHAIEALLSRVHPAGSDPDRVFVGKNRISDSLALLAVEAIAAGLERAVADGTDLEARREVLYGATLAGLAFGTAGTNVAHALQYPVGGRSHTPHGLGVGLLLPFGMAFNAAPRERELTAIAARLGAGADAAEPAAAVARVRELGLRVGLPRSLAEVGIERDELPAMAAQAASITRLAENSARPLDQPAALRILTAAWEGREPEPVSEDGA